mmetsp:Transcript_19976/g.64349  ORF Transcript_19976/g.64349 Transcript_19976/m.64349 type:complete len:131 (-) Transcript_19976:58-450(-)
MRRRRIFYKHTFDGGRCALLFRKLGCLVEPLRLRDVTLVPVVPFGDLPALQTEDPTPGWWCQCATPVIRRRRLQSTERGGNNRSNPCFDAGQFLCPCERVLARLEDLGCADGDDMGACTANTDSSNSVAA